MKNLTLRRIVSGVLTLSLLFALAGCNYDKPITTETEEFYLTKNDEMDEATKAALGEITAAFEEYLTSANPEGIKPYLDDDFETTNEQLKQFANSFVSNNATFTLYDSYYIKDIKPDTVTKMFKKSETADEGVELTPASDEMYLALYSTEEGWKSYVEKVSHMVSLLCAKDGGKWEIVWVDASDVKYNGEDARAILEKAVKASEDGKFLSSYIYSLMLNLTMRPGNALVYDNYLDMEDFYYKTATEFQKQYPLPYVPESLPGTKLHAIALANEEQGIIPLIVMESPVKLSDERRLRVQAKAVLEDLNLKSPGFTEDFPVIAISAVASADADAETVNFILTAEE